MNFAGTMKVNKQGHLEIGGCDTVELATKFGTPLYILDEDMIRENCLRYLQALHQYYPHGKIVYAGKAFLSLAMARLLDEEGLGLDVVSGGELYTALQAGFPASKLYFHGNNKTRDELKYALQNNTGTIVVDSMQELSELVRLSPLYGSKKTAVLFRIKPGITAYTHEFVQTGQDDSKFGFGLADGSIMDAIQIILKSSHLELKGFHCHLGSQIFQLEPFRLAAKIMVNFIASVREKTGYLATELDLGGGLGIRYGQGDTPPSIEAFVKNIALAVKETAEKRKLPLPRLVLEPGRSIIGEAGTTLYRIGVIKDIPGIRRYVSIDGGMMDNIRPALYGARYHALLANKAAQDASEKVTIAGKACESGDILIKDIYLPRVESGDLLAVLSTGAYCYSMASVYNHNPRPAVIFVRDGEPRIIIRRETYADLIALNEP
ncbi:MAG: diaminopimelate decarboxylase [Dethiobacteria bacterium]|jgi:diaminopimelate decarboxylase